MVERALKNAKRGVVTAAGILLLGTGVALIVLPGPALLVIPLGLGVLATEYGWAGKLLSRLRERAYRMRERLPGQLRQLVPVETERREAGGGPAAPDREDRRQ